MSKPPSKPAKGRKAPQTPEGSPKATEALEGALPGQERALHSRARAKLAEVCERLKGGTPINHACALEGIPRQAFYDLIGADEDAALLVAAARAHGAEEYRGNLVALALGGGAERANANVLLHLMERLYPDDYAPPKQRVEASGPGGGPIETANTITITRDEAISIARKRETK